MTSLLILADSVLCDLLPCAARWQPWIIRSDGEQIALDMRFTSKRNAQAWCRWFKPWAVPPGHVVIFDVRRIRARDATAAEVM